MRRAQEYAEAGLLPTMQGKLDYLYMRQKQKLDTKAAESLEKGGDYAKSPTGLTTWNGIPQMQYGISLMTNENQIRSQLLNTLDAEARAEAERINTLKANLQMPSLSEQFAAFQSAPIGDKTIIHGDEITQISLPDLKAEMEKAQAQMQEQQEFFMQQVQENSALENYMTPNNDSVQSMQQITFETVVTPLNNIEAIASNILTAIENRQPAQVNISPSISNNLGGAYVFDNAMRKALVDDITSRIVTEITSAVKQATSQADFSYGA